MENEITINGVIHSVVKEHGEFFLSMPKTRCFLRIKAEGTVLKNAYAHVGERVSVHGKLASEDAMAINPCECNTMSKTIESYIIADSVQKAPFINHVKIKGIITDTPKLIRTPAKEFYTCRIRLADACGYMSVSTPEHPGNKGDYIAVEGHLQWKDYNRILSCNRCKKAYAAPTLSLLVVSEERRYKQ